MGNVYLTILNYFLRIAVQISHFLLFFSEWSVYISQFWEKKAELWDVNSGKKKVAITFFIFLISDINGLP